MPFTFQTPQRNLSASFTTISSTSSRNNKRSLFPSLIILRIIISVAILFQLFFFGCNAQQTLNNELKTNSTSPNLSLLQRLLLPNTKPARHKRFTFFGDEVKPPGNYCSNGGTFHRGKCQCRYPYAGDHCDDYACQNGLSTGPRYDPESEFFNKKCICDEHWSGELCHIPIANQCNERGSYINGRCHCHGYYFGPACQYVGKCVHGTLKAGICECNYGFEGDYCELIVCHHGYVNKANHSKSCVCPERHTGFFCDECKIQDVPVYDFPNCTLIIRPTKAKMSRSKTDQLIIKRILIIFVVVCILIIFLATICVHKWGVERAGPSNVELELKQVLKERQAMLKETIFAQDHARRNSRYADPMRLDHEQI